MIYIEMSRDVTHGGDLWGFTNCVWAPTKKRNGTKWPFWSKILDVHQADIVIHLRGINPVANFVGYSIASDDGFETSQRPPDPKEWDFASKFFRADLTQYTPFHQPINVSKLFVERRAELENYFENNKAPGSPKKNIFYVKQSGRLQCLNGAYLSDADQELLEALFGSGEEIISRTDKRILVTSETGTQITLVQSRLGQARFSSRVKVIYGNRCCFPGCKVTDPRFLVGAHIARWSDNEKLRGNLGNGLCLCLVHDKAFEIGLFTLDDEFRIYVNPRERTSDSSIVEEVVRHHGEQITLAEIHPLEDALLEHWIRVDIEPWMNESVPMLMNTMNLDQ